VLDEDGAQALLEGARDVASGLGLAETVVRPRAS